MSPNHVFLIVFLETLILVIKNCSSQSNERPDDWSYNHQDYWNHISKFCAGKRQSPINLNSFCKRQSKKRSRRPSNLEQSSPSAILDTDLWVNFIFYYDPIPANRIDIANNGHSAQLDIRSADTINDVTPKISGYALDDNVYQLTQLHFHWHKFDNHKGSEHALDGRRHALEMHLVHFNSKYETLYHAGQFDDGLAVVAVLFDVQRRDNVHFKTITDSLAKIRQFKNETSITKDLYLYELLPKKFESFFKYKGSLTTPPCSEDVTWIIFPEVLKIGAKQLEQFRRINVQAFKGWDGSARTLQNVGNRTIYASKEYCRSPVTRYLSRG